MTEPNFNQAAAAYEVYVLDSNEGVDPVGLMSEAADDLVRMELAAKKLKLAVETYISDLNGCTYVWPILSDAEELCRLIIDYDQDNVGHRASDVLRASLKVGEK